LISCVTGRLYLIPL